MGGGRPALRAQHDRHARPRGLHLRGVALPGGVRGRRPAHRRGPGHRGPDPGEPLPGPGERPRHHPRPQQDRPARRPAREVRPRGRPAHRRRPGRGAAGVGQDRGGRGGAARPHRRGRPRPRGRPRCADSGHDLRLRVRHVQGRRHLRARRRRLPGDPPARAHDVDGRHPRTAGDRRHLARAHALRGHRRGRGRLPHHRCEGRAPVAGGRHRHLGRQRRRAGARRLPRPQPHGVLRHLPGGRLGLPGPARRPGAPPAQRRRPHLRTGVLRRPRIRVPLRLPGPAAPGDHP